MPKISNNSIKVFHKDIHKHYDIVVNYNQKRHFYAMIPLEFKEIVHHLSHEEQKSMFITEELKPPYGSKEYEQFIDDETEGGCLKKVKNCLEILIDKSINQRKVIIVFFNPKDNCNYNDHRYNHEHSQIGLQFGLTYAVETSVGDKKVYSTYTVRTYLHGEEFVDRNELRLYDKAATIIPDTKENRIMLEQLYTNLVILMNKLKEFTSSSEKMISYIENGIKMLGE